MSFFYNLNDKLNAIREKPEVTHQQLNERDMGKHNNATTGFKALADKTNDKIAGAQFQKMKKAGQLEEEGMSRAAKGYEKYGKPGMEALAKAGRDGKSLDPVRKKYDKYDNTEVDEGVMDTVKSVGKKVASGINKLVGHGSDEDMRRDVQRKAGVPQTGKKPDQKTTEAAKYRDPKYKDRLYTQEPPDYTYGPDYDDAYDNPKPDDYAGRKRKIGGGEFDHNDPLVKGFGRSGTGSPVEKGPRKGLPTRNQISSLKGSIKDASGTHAEPNLPEAGAPMTAKQKSFAKLAPPANKITFADKIAGAKKEVDEMLGDVAAEAMRSALSGGQKKLDKNQNGKLDANDFAMLRKGGKNAEMDEAMPPRGKMTPSGKMTPKKFKAVFNGPLDWPRIVKFKDRLMGQGMEPEEAEQEAAERLGFEYEEVLDYLDLMNSTNEENDFTAHQRPAVTQPRVGSTERGHKHDITHSISDPRYKGRTVIRRTDPQGISVDAETDDEGNKKVKRTKAGRPDGTGKKIGAKGPSGDSKLMTREGEVSTGNLQQMHQLVTGLKSYVQDPDGQALLKELMSLIKHYATQDNEQELDEKAVSKQQQKFMGMAHAMQKGEKVKGASKELKKVASTMKPKDTEDFAKTKHKGLPDKAKSKKKEEDVEESTTAGSVATSTATKGGGGMVGKGIYDSMNRELENMIAESMTINMSDSTEGGKSLTITATDEDALKLGMLLKNAGLGSGDAHGGDMHSSGEQPCATCGMPDCGCGDVQEAVDENSPDWPTDTETSNNALQYSGGLNKPKSSGMATIPVTDVQVDGEDMFSKPVHEEDDLRRMMEMAGLAQANLTPGKHTMQAMGPEMSYSDSDPEKIKYDNWLRKASDKDLWDEASKYESVPDYIGREFEKLVAQQKELLGPAAYREKGINDRLKSKLKKYPNMSAPMKEEEEEVEEDFLESIQRMRAIAGIKEAKKPDFLDMDKDGNKKEPMSKAVKDKEEKKVDESIFALTNQWKAYKG